ncbi:hypothetical protein [Microscilla marina]|uniref:Topoisomerase 6 subunit A/Spo11 TOPRIM domain-containing protein n=1 Tax=Microscilla marina ATCC 23134 TaxID=313606 RepID=A1ZDX3_MICM2|nr:hypothetical protein [Microscilla marina]EAY31281.1 hypothetical protein M23134_04114 [Microscilla marina ATCC 23134]
MDDLLFTQPDWQLFTNINTLPQQAGVSKHLLPRLIAKELTDNALDVDTQVHVFHPEEGKPGTFVVKNLGKGFDASDEEIADFFSVKRPLTSSKRFRLPSRGALGNGLRVVTATVFCLEGTLTVATNGRVLQLIPQDDGTTLPKKIGEFADEGTEIQVSIPHDYFYYDTLEWAELALAINQGVHYTGKTCPHWYDSDSFYNLCLSTPAKVTVSQFTPYFEGIAKSKAKAMINQLGDLTIAQLSRDESEQLLGALRENSKYVPAKKLGEVGAIEGFIGYVKKMSEFTLKTTRGEHHAQIPVVIEAYARLNEASDKTRFFVNRTPIIGDVDVIFNSRRLIVYGCGLNSNIDNHRLKAPPEIWLNITTPYMPIVSNGKEPDLSVLEEAIVQTIEKTVHQLRRKLVARDKEDAPASQQAKPPSQKKVVLQNLTAAIDKASGQGQYRYSLRQLYYVLRPFVMEATRRELKYQNFNTIITDYEFDTGKDLPGVYRDERGTLLHPHTHEEIRLGTKSVERYHRPVFNFNKILYSEKEGFFEILKDAGFCEKHDCALLTSKGFASRAARDVIDLLAETEEELLFFCIHDADISGTLIYQALQGATKARPKRKVKIINLGLEPWQGLAMQLEVEMLERSSKKTPAQYVLDFDNKTDVPKPYKFEGQMMTRWEDWLKEYRIELNAMDTPTFIKWLDTEVSKHDNGKVVPDEPYLQATADQDLQVTLKSRIRDELLQQLDIEQMVAEKLEKIYPKLKEKISQTDLKTQVHQSLENMPKNSWSKSFSEIMRGLLDK